jgi:hypothetical protein
MGINCYKEGFERGKSDALKGKAKSYIGFPKAKALLSSKCYDTYVKGYDEGYKRGMIR